MPIVYATFEDMKERFEEADLMQLANVATIDEAQPYIELKLGKAFALINGYVSAYYGDLSDLPIPQLLTECACDIAFYEMFRRERTEKAKEDRAAAIATLTGISKGTIKIDGGDIHAQPARPGAVLIEGGDRKFTRDKMRGF